MRVRFILLVILSILAAGCAARWEHSSKRSSEFYADDRDCQAVAGGASAGIEAGSERISYESCMWERGWRKKRSIWFFDPPSK